MKPTALVRTSKFLSLILRHEPEKFGVVLDAAGWTGVDALLEACARHGHPLDRVELGEVVATSEKKRFAFDETGTRIRASQGHSVEVELGYEPATPPAYLYHGTATRFLDAIRISGLLKMQRHHVHLSADEVAASAVGQRHGKPTVLVIDAAAMTAEGAAFFLSANGVWLVEHVPMRFILFPNDSD
ncbi:MAG: RNA 2'-phosphotransferase [Alphaproteobacteria bacterium]|nr:RNA 2'-phosphotransferase [Alphaproteobacteria bacterium]